VQYTRMAPFSSKTEPRVPADDAFGSRQALVHLVHLVRIHRIEGVVVLPRAPSLNTSARHSRIGTEPRVRVARQHRGVRHTSSLPERPRSNTAPVIFRPTTQTPPDDRRSPRDRRTRPDRDPAGTGRAPQLALAGRAPSVPQRPNSSEPRTALRSRPRVSRLTMRERPVGVIKTG
jgi:hypothetical protein